jgi:hypothetical protein
MTRTSMELIMTATAFATRTFRLLALPAFSALALACNDAPLPQEPQVAANDLISDDAVPSRQQGAALLGVPHYWADAYVWASNATTGVPYDARSDYAFSVVSNRGGGFINVAKPVGTTGQYTLTFPGLSAWLGSKSTLHVTSDNASGYGIPDDVHCKPVTAYLVSDKVEVRCFRASTGAASNGAFRVMVTRNYMDLAFAYAHQPSSTNYSPEAKGSWNPGGTSKIIRHGVGQYEVVFNNLGPQIPAGIGGHVQVSAVGTGNKHCKMEDSGVWTDVSVRVRCFSQAGQLADSKFTVLFVSPAAHLAYTLGDKPSTPSYTPLSSFSSNPAGGAITITRTAVGRYRIQWAGVDPQINGFGTIQVTAWGSDNTQCRVNIISGYNHDFADVLCFGAAGVLTDARFTVLLGS